MTWEFVWEPGLNTWRRSSLRCSDTTKSSTGEQHLPTPVQLWKPWNTAAVQRLSSRNISVLFAHTGLGIKGISFPPPPTHTTKDLTAGVRVHPRRQHRGESHGRCCFSRAGGASSLFPLSQDPSRTKCGLWRRSRFPSSSHPALLLHHPPPLSLNFLLVDREGISLT